MKDQARGDCYAADDPFGAWKNVSFRWVNAGVSSDSYLRQAASESPSALRPLTRGRFMYSELALYAATPALAGRLLPDPLQYFREISPEVAALRNGELQPDRVYVGSEMCAGQLPSPQLLRDILLGMKELGVKVTLALPILWMDEVKIAEELLSMLAEAPLSATEVVCNDIGMLSSIAGMEGLSPVAGRLMTKTCRDPRHGVLQHPDLRAHPDVAFGSCLIAEPASSLLASFGVRRIEADAPLDMAARHLCGKGFDISVHYPWRYVTSGRICSFAGVGRDHDRRFMPGAKCNRLCREYFLQMKGEVGGEVILHGNTVLWAENESLATARISGEKPISGLRLVFNPLPMRRSKRQ